MAWRVQTKTSDVVQTLRLAFGDEFIDSITHEQLESFVAQVRTHRYRKGEAIYHEDDLPGDNYIVSEGWVKHQQVSATGGQYTHRLSPVGDYFGRMAGSRRVGGTVALTECALLVVERSVFFDFISLARAPIAYLMQRQAQRSADLLRKIHDLAFLNVPMRLASVLLEVSQPTDVQGHSKLVVPDYFNQTEIAHLVGASRESVNQWLKHFAERQWISIESKHIVIDDEAALRQSME